MTASVYVAARMTYSSEKRSVIPNHLKTKYIAKVSAAQLRSTISAENRTTRAVTRRGHLCQLAQIDAPQGQDQRKGRHKQRECATKKRTHGAHANTANRNRERPAKRGKPPQTVRSTCSEVGGGAGLRVPIVT